MPIFLREDSKNFFQEFSHNLEESRAPGDKTLLLYHSRLGFGLEAKSAPWYERICRWLNPFITTNIQSIEARLHRMVLERSENKDSLFSAPELLATSRSSGYLSSLFKHVQKRSQPQEFTMAAA